MLPDGERPDDPLPDEDPPDEPLPDELPDDEPVPDEALLPAPEPADEPSPLAPSACVAPGFESPEAFTAASEPFALAAPAGSFAAARLSVR